MYEMSAQKPPTAKRFFALFVYSPLRHVPTEPEVINTYHPQTTEYFHYP